MTQVFSKIGRIGIVPMNIKSAENLLEFWQEIYGELDSSEQRQFLKDGAIGEILTHPTENIKVAVRRNKLLIDVLKDLQLQVEKKEAFLETYDKYRNSREPEPKSKIENREREGERWGRTY